MQENTWLSVNVIKLSHVSESKGIFSWPKLNKKIIFTNPHLKMKRDNHTGPQNSNVYRRYT